MSDDHTLAAAQAAQSAAIDAREALRDVAALLDADVDWRAYTLKTDNGYLVTARPHTDWPTRSIGIYNPHDVTVYFGLGGGSPTLGQHAPSVPPNGLLVLPLRVGAIEIGIDPADVAALAAADVTVYVMRFAAPQAAVLAAL